MKRLHLLFAALLCAALLAGCSAPGAAPGPAPAEGGQPAAPPAPAEGNAPEPGPTAEPAALTLRIVDGAGDGSLLLAGIGEARGLYRLGVQPGDAVTIDGQPATAADLADGMELTVYFDGGIAESWPAQFYNTTALKAVTPGGGSYYDLCGLYLKVLDDLWNTDPALNGNISVAGLDLSQAPGALSESEKDGIAWRFGELHGVEVVRGTMETLTEQGYIPQGDAPPHWEDGCLFSITGADADRVECYSLPVLNFDAGKWRGGTGACFFTGCTAVWPEFGPCAEYTVEACAVA